jgi:hypothetical protein
VNSGMTCSVNIVMLSMAASWTAHPDLNVAPLPAVKEV